MKTIKLTELRIKVGGSFVWPPPDIDVDQIQRVVLVADGGGIKYVLRAWVMVPYRPG